MGSLSILLTRRTRAPWCYPVRIPNDFHTFEGDTRTGDWCVALNLRNTPPEVLVPGTRVFLYDSGDIEGEGIVQRGKRYDWVAEMIPETICAPGDEGYSCGRGADPNAPEDELSAREHAIWTGSRGAARS